MKCKSCGREIRDNVIFCNYCGKKVKMAQSVQNESMVENVDVGQDAVEKEHAKPDGMIENVSVKGEIGKGVGTQLGSIVENGSVKGEIGKDVGTQLGSMEECCGQAFL